MAGKNDFTATAGISLEQWKKDIKTMSSDMGVLVGKVDKLSESISGIGESLEPVKQAAEDVSGAMKTISSGLKVATVTAYTGNIISSFAGVNVAIGNTESVFKKMQFTAFGDAMPEGMDRVKNAMLDVADSSIEAIRLIPGLSKEGADAMISAARSAQNYALAQIQVAVATGQEAESTDALAAKLVKLRDMRTTEHAKGPGFRNEENVGRLNNSITETSRKYVEAANREMEAGKENSAGQTQRIALAQLEIERKQKLATLSESLKNQLGEKGAAGNVVYDAGAAKIEREIALKRRSIEMSETQEKVSVNLNEIAETISVTYFDQLHLQEEKIAANQIEVQKAEKLYGAHSLIASQLRVQGHELTLQQQQMEYMHAAAITQAKDATIALDANMAGNKTLAEIESHRVANAQKIRDAIREGNDELAQQYAKQQALNDLESRARQLRRTPKQIQDERKEQEAQDRAIRHINAVEKNNPNSVASDGRNHVSAATQKARAEYAARHAAPIIKKANDKINNITADTIVVTTIKPK
jgi:uncharacterized protein YoxC